MKKIVLLLVTAFAFCQCKSSLPAQPNFKISIQLTSTYQLRGGMAPSPEDQLASRTETPLANHTLFIRSGSLNNPDESPLIELVTDEFGYAECTLPKGSYCLVDAQKADRTQLEEWMKEYKVPSENWSAIDVECLEEWIAKPLLKFEINPEKEEIREELRLNIYKKCYWNSIPCVGYSGPYPS